MSRRLPHLLKHAATLIVAMHLTTGCIVRPENANAPAHSTFGTGTRSVIEAMRSGSIEKVEDDPHYAIYRTVVKEYPATAFLVQSSGSPIDLGEAMVPLLDTRKLRAFADAHGVRALEDSPAEVYLYHWVDRAQGPMVFDVGFMVDVNTPAIPNDLGFEIKRYPPMKFASIVYEGPFPHEPRSGWGHIRWEERAKAQGHVYTERLYRELYHLFDYGTYRHITEIQIEIE